MVLADDQNLNAQLQNIGNAVYEEIFDNHKNF
jgi:hypothetical protein